MTRTQAEKIVQKYSDIASTQGVEAAEMWTHRFGRARFEMACGILGC